MLWSREIYSFFFFYRKQGVYYASGGRSRYIVEGGRKEGSEAHKMDDFVLMKYVNNVQSLVSG
jgi:hypothetical protein